MSPKTNDLTLEFILLGLLQQGPLHGYALYQRLQGMGGLSRIWHVKQSKLYYLLEKLEGEGHLRSRVETHPSHPDRKTFQLTGAGRRAFRSWVRSPVESGRHMRIAFLSRLFFALRAGRGEALSLVQAQKDLTQSWKDSLERQLAALDEPDFITRQIFRFRLGQVQAMLEWIEACEKDIAHNKESES